MLKTILIANRGEIALRVMRTARKLGIKCVAVYSDADVNARHVVEADEAFRVGPAPARESYLRIDAIIGAAKRAHADAIHPGYGFLSERPEFVEACEAAGIVFIGPPASAMRAMGLKDAAKALMEKAGVPVVPGYHGASDDPDVINARAADLGYPLLVKAAAGGGGKGMRRVDCRRDLAGAVETASREAKSSFGDGRILFEKYLAHARHIEVQVFADGHGNAVSLFERDCSLQRRHQKVIEEAPAPGLTQEMRNAMGQAAVKATSAVGYVGAGTVEFIADISDGLRPDRFYFLEMNTRLQVEHPVTEAITGLDLVEWQLRVAAGEPLPLLQDQLTIAGHAFEARIYAEDPSRQFLPATGRLDHLRLSAHARVDSGVGEGDLITPYYDPMIAKVIVHGADRGAALARLATALDECQVLGCATNIAFLSALARHPDVMAGNVSTDLIEREVVTLTALHPPSDESIALAALARFGLLLELEGCNPWRTLIGWRPWGEARIPFGLLWRDHPIDGYVVPAGPHAFRFELGGRLLACAITADGENRVRVVGADRAFSADIVVTASEIGVFIGGRHDIFTWPAPIAATTVVSHDASVSGRHVSPMTGLVKVIAAKVGDRIAAGDVLVIIEAMKLEHAVAAGKAGVVAELFVKPGDQVAEAQELLLITEAPCAVRTTHG